MTAEITIMNKGAIALAADSAVTVGGAKIYNSANKLFMLSKYHPIGIMIYQNADFMDIPWETIIKNFRKTMGDKEYKTVREYAVQLIDYIEKNEMFFNEERQKDIFIRNVALIFSEIKTEASDKYSKLQYEAYNNAVKNKSLIEEVNQEPIFKDVIDAKYNKYKNEFKVIENLIDFKDDVVVEKYKELLKKSVDEKFQDSPINEDLRSKLYSIAVNYFLRNNFSGERFINYTGLVIAGFGSDEHFPAYVHFMVDNIFEKKLKYSSFDEGNLEKSGGAVIRFFAQDQMGRVFMRGIEKELESKSIFHIFRKFIEFRNETVNILNLEGTKKEEYIKKTDEMIKAKISEYRQALGSFINNKFVYPVLDTVASLPKDELASMAEALVNLASFKKRVSGEIETVGGPIDVAVISKGDGFVWIKRKHYFDIEFNHHFRENYYLGDLHESKEN